MAAENRCPVCGEQAVIRADVHGWMKCRSCRAMWDENAVRPHEKLVSVECNFFDEEEVHYNCTVYIWRNSVTGEQSIGWKEEGQ